MISALAVCFHCDSRQSNDHIWIVRVFGIVHEVLRVSLNNPQRWSMLSCVSTYNHIKHSATYLPWTFKTGGVRMFWIEATYLGESRYTADGKSKIKYDSLVSIFWFVYATFAHTYQYIISYHLISWFHICTNVLNYTTVEDAFLHFPIL